MPSRSSTRRVDPRFIDTRSRPVLAQTFEDLATGARFTVVVNHLKSKGSACTDIGDPDAGDGQGNCNRTRKAAAEALVDWLATDPTGSGDRDYLILGDLNSYAKEDPIDAIKAGADDIAGTADDYTNLIAKYQGTYAHSYVFDGQAGYLDHALASPTLVGQVTGAADWHINSDEPDVVDYDTTFKPPAQEALYEPNPYRSSDHDPVVVGLNLLNYQFEGFECARRQPAGAQQGPGRPAACPFTFQPRPRPRPRRPVRDADVDPVHVRDQRRVGRRHGDRHPAGPRVYDPADEHATPRSGRRRKRGRTSAVAFEITFDDGTYRTADFKLQEVAPLRPAGGPPAGRLASGPA